MWQFSQSTGRLFQDGQLRATGYAGAGEGKNNPAMQGIENVGPLPQGVYAISDTPFDSQSHGPFCLRLTPDAANEMFGRAGFLIHGDSIAEPGTASEGCMIFSRAIRGLIHDSNDKELHVVEFDPQEAA